MSLPQYVISLASMEMENRALRSSLKKMSTYLRAYSMVTQPSNLLRHKSLDCLAKAGKLLKGRHARKG